MKTGSPCSRDPGRLCHRSPPATGSHDMESGYRGEREREWINIQLYQKKVFLQSVTQKPIQNCSGKNVWVRIRKAATG